MLREGEEKFSLVPEEAGLPRSPQEDQSSREAKSASSAVENAPLPDHWACFSRGSLWRRIHQAAVGRHNYENRVGPICEQDHGTKQPTPL